MIFETVAIIQGVPRHLAFHQQRLDRSRKALGLEGAVIELDKVIVVPEEYQQGLVRCRINVAEEVQSVTFSPFKPSPVRHLILVEREISYPHKFCDRSAFEQLRVEHSEFDDVIITREGMLTDSTMANLALFDGEQWITPTTPLLPGTMRARLVQAGTLLEREVHRRDLPKYQGIVLINALRGFNPEAAVPAASISGLAD